MEQWQNTTTCYLSGEYNINIFLKNLKSFLNKIQTNILTFSIHSDIDNFSRHTQQKD
jgi:hypothetical protein